MKESSSIAFSSNLVGVNWRLNRKFCEAEIDNRKKLQYFRLLIPIFCLTLISFKVFLPTLVPTYIIEGVLKVGCMHSWFWLNVITILRQLEVEMHSNRVQRLYTSICEKKLSLALGKGNLKILYSRYLTCSFSVLAAMRFTDSSVLHVMENRNVDELEHFLTDDHACCHARFFAKHDWHSNSQQAKLSWK